MVVLETIAAAFYHIWLWALAGVVGVLYVGVIGARLHPALSASQLRQGPTEGDPARREMAAMTRDQMIELIAAAYPRLMPLLTALVAANLLVMTAWRWYVAIPVAFCVAILLLAVIGVSIARYLKAA